MVNETSGLMLEAMDKLFQHRWYETRMNAYIYQEQQVAKDLEEDPEKNEQRQRVEYTRRLFIAGMLPRFLGLWRLILVQRQSQPFAFSCSASMAFFPEGLLLCQLLSSNMASLAPTVLGITVNPTWNPRLHRASRGYCNRHSYNSHCRRSMGQTTSIASSMRYQCYCRHSAGCSLGDHHAHDRAGYRY